MFDRFGMLVGGALVLTVSPAVAQTGDQSKPPIVVKGRADRMICRTEETTGSRLGPVVKRCMTAQQWAEAKQFDRADIEHIQTQRYKNN